MRRAISSLVRRRPSEVGEALAEIPQSRMVSFSIIAHVDHGKSSLSQRLLELQGNVATGEESALDTLEVEKSRGITVKAVTASMMYGEWLVNLVDTPGHVDFAHEVRRSLAACDGALLLVDAAQGIEAQTLSVAAAARSAGVPLIAACSKCDLVTADPDAVALALCASGLVEDDDPDRVLRLSAKTGLGVPEVLPAVLGFAKQEASSRSLPLRARVVDSRYDAKRGAVCVVRVVDGVLRENQKIIFLSRPEEALSVQEVGLLTPAPLRSSSLPAGCVGYAICGLRDVRRALVGDTVAESAVEPLEAGFQPAIPALYASVFPPDGALFDDMARAVDRLALNDAAVTVEREPPRPSLGSGLRVGFLGVLHMDVFRQRLRDEFDADVLFCAPLVPYRLVKNDATVVDVKSLDDWPAVDDDEVEILEPVVDVDVLVPTSFLGAAVQTLEPRAKRQLALETTGETTVLKYVLPWARVVDGLSEELANATRGYASLAVDHAPRFETARGLVKVDIALNGTTVDALSFVAARDDAVKKGRDAAASLKTHVPRHQFEVVVQAKIGGKVLARDRIPPFRKDVLTKGGKTVGGGDVTRKKKLLEKQKQGKKRQKTIGNVALSQDAFWAVLNVKNSSR
ncbi:hypothetical protein CTAYLR_003582 [Chrysophaeum taylorii]|uniref:Translation factor GUF1 homolog, mitochondrial n=1 Tax=Chrysophaeum taylorii TaxID=2483200 RepID=A0AAD7UKZ1_9STRA|nr:hypothetical protein CTAYLR_003582 [Chrysophaeum taylorii]